MVVDTRKNKVFINEDDIIVAIVHGDQDAHSINMMFDSSIELCDKLRAEGKPIIVLDDLLLMGAVPPEGRRAVVEHLKNMSYDRFAFLSKDKVTRVGANLILQATGKASKIKFFDDADEANTWLTSKD